jgi:hypothetical protein
MLNTFEAAALAPADTCPTVPANLCPFFKPFAQSSYPDGFFIKGAPRKIADPLTSADTRAKLVTP